MSEYKYTIYVTDKSGEVFPVDKAEANHEHDVISALNTFKKKYCNNCRNFEVFEAVVNYKDVTKEFEEKLNDFD